MTRALIVAALIAAAFTAGWLLCYLRDRGINNDLRNALTAVPCTPDTADYRQQIADASGLRGRAVKRESYLGRMA